MIELNGLSVTLAGRPVLNDLTLTIPSGTFTGVLGPNGAGKTTLFRVLLGLIRPSAGRITMPPGPVGYMPQARTLAAGHLLLAHEFIAQAASGTRWGLPHTSPATRATIAHALDLVDATALAQRPVGTLSGGERQRVLLAQALLNNPKLLILDEPMQGLDPRRQSEIIALVARLHQSLGLTVLLSAHELNPLLGALDLVLYMGGGAAAIGPVQDVVTAPILSLLYGTPVEILHAGGHVFVMAGGHVAERDCLHGHG